MEASDKKIFLKNILTLTSGTLFAQLISVIALVFLQRFFYDPDDIANFTWFFEFVTVFASVGALRLETGIIIERDHRDARILTEYALKLMLLAGFLSLLVAFIGQFFNNNFSKVLSSNWNYALIPLAVIAIGVIQILTAWFTRAQSFKFLAGNKLYQSIASTSVQFGFGALKATQTGLIIGRIFGLFVTGAFMLRKYFSEKEALNRTTSEDRRRIFKHHQNFVWFTTPGTFLGNFINFLFIDLFLTYYGEALTGDLGAAKYYIGIGLAIISSSFAQVFYSELGKMNDPKQIKKYYTYWLIRLSGIAVGILGIIYLIPNSLVIYILGEKWSNLLGTMKIMSIWMVIMFVSSSLSYVYIKLKKQGVLIFYDLLHLVLVWASIHVSFTLYGDFTTSLYWFTLAQSLFYILSVFLAYYFLNRSKSLEN